MKKTIAFLLMVSIVHFATAQSVGIGTTTPDSKSLLDISSTLEIQTFRIAQIYMKILVFVL